MSISDYAENQLLDAVFNADAFSVANVYVKLHTGDPGEAGTSNAATETTRKEMTAGAASSGATSNDNQIQWTNLAATETVSHISLWDASSGGNCLWSGALTASKSLNAGDTFTIAIAAIVVTLA